MEIAEIEIILKDSQGQVVSVIKRSFGAALVREDYESDVKRLFGKKERMQAGEFVKGCKEVWRVSEPTVYLRISRMALRKEREGRKVFFLKPEMNMEDHVAKILDEWEDDIPVSEESEEGSFTEEDLKKMFDL